MKSKTTTETDIREKIPDQAIVQGNGGGGRLIILPRSERTF